MTDTQESPIKHRPIRSFVLRQGRMSKAQTRAVETLMPRWGIPYQNAEFDFSSAFGKPAPFILEIGFGMGDSTAAIAAAHTQNNYLGIEVHGPGVGSLLNQIEGLNLTNLRVIQHDAVEVLKNMAAPASLDGVQIFFPDPWHKTKHHKRRLIQPELVGLLCKKLKSGGYLHVATDWQEYAEHILAVFNAEPLLANTATDYAPKPDYRPLTKFEQRGIKLGHGVWDIVFKKN